MSKYSLGMDFGTLSCRAVLADVQDGSVIASAAAEYAHGVLTERLPTGTALPDGWALQHPQDYLNAMVSAVQKAVSDSGIHPESIIGIGVDFTASTALPVTSDGTPLCMLPQFAANPHAYVKLWKHHGAARQVEQLNAIVAKHPLERLQYYGGSFGPESSLPRQLALLKEAPEIYHAMAQWVEAGDWIVWQLTGSLSRSISGAGIKEMFDVTTGTYPDKSFLRLADERLENLYEEKHCSLLLPLGARAGGLIPEMADQLGLRAGTAVAAANMDGHVSAPVIGMERPNAVMAVIGTSCGWFTLSNEEKPRAIPGLLGAVKHSMWPDMVCYEAGQSCVGDMYQWFADHCVPTEYRQQAQYEHISIQSYLTQLAQRLTPGSSGLLALDWFNGCRSPFADSNLSGMVLGLTLRTRPEEIYRALLEAAAYGGRMIVENYRAHGMSLSSVIATGGISRKNPLAMQIYADVLNMPVFIAASDNGPAHGAALYGAVAAGSAQGGYDTVRQAAESMRQPFAGRYTPDPQSVSVYEELYQEYKQLAKWFAQGGSNVMQRLGTIRRIQRGE